MDRTTVMLPAQLKARAQRRAQELGISMGEFIRDALDEALSTSARDRVEDPLFSDLPVFDGPWPSDMSINHDNYLYGDE